MDTESVVYDAVSVNPNDALKNEALKVEAELFPEVAELGKTGDIGLSIQVETEIERWVLPRLISENGRFYSARIEKVQTPIKYGRLVIGADVDCGARQYDFPTSVRDKRFLHIQRMIGAYQGENPVNRNQLLDACHLWCAEASNC